MASPEEASEILREFDNLRRFCTIWQNDMADEVKKLNDALNEIRSSNSSMRTEFIELQRANQVLAKSLLSLKDAVGKAEISDRDKSEINRAIAVSNQAFRREYDVDRNEIASALSKILQKLDELKTPVKRKYTKRATKPVAVKRKYTKRKIKPEPVAKRKYTKRKLR